MITRFVPLRRINRLTLVGMAVIVVLTTVLTAATPATAGVPGTVHWDTGPSNITRSGTKSVFPAGAVDSNNKLHIMYATDNGTFWYINNVAGSFSPPQAIGSASLLDTYRYFALAVGPDNTLHVVYTALGKDYQVYYRHGILNGAVATWSAPKQISGGFKSYGANLFVDQQGTAHIVWIDNRCGQYNVFYRRLFANGVLSGTNAPNNDCGYQRQPQIVVTNDGKTHMVLYRENEVYYYRLESGYWYSKNLSTSGNIFSGNPTLTTDGTAIYVAWDEGVNGHDIRFRRSVDGGQTWSSMITVSGTPEFASFPNVSWAPASRRVYIAWSDATGASDLHTEIWFREFDPVTGTSSGASRLTYQGGDSGWPMLASPATRAELVWQDKAPGFFQVYREAGQIQSQSCNGSLTLNGSITLPDGTPAIHDNTITGSITPESGCVPTHMQVSLDTPPTDSTPQVAYSSTISVPISDSALTSCVHTVYVRLLVNGSAGAIFSKNIVVDKSVTADVRAVNPNMTILHTAAPTDGGAQDGDPNYTRNGTAYLQIIGDGDCVGLLDFAAPNNPTQTISNSIFRGPINLPNTSGQGVKTFQVSVRDKLTNSDLFPSRTSSFSITYDTTPPVLDMTKSPDVSSPSTTDSPVVTLNFSKIHVADNLYGPNEGLNNDAEFWGVWLASSRTANPNPATLKWSAAPVPQPGPDFSVTYSLFSGLNYGPVYDKAGDYYVFAKVLDGAGNASTSMIGTGKITLTSPYDIPTVQLPMLSR